ncbi:MAG: type II toxin-antitoxin system prevent-host-death family antitoxin [Gemmatimonadetes bacterium]|jgi:prevent-host-death family protein|nr:type II toxin-antitoxin system prevent-host-death family antitoxin [Gemmatimonadota bacterium]
MIKVSASKLRKDLFEYLDRVLAGETVVIERNKREVARLVPTRQLNWRDKMSNAPKLLVPPEDLIEPIDDIWEEHA